MVGIGVTDPNDIDISALSGFQIRPLLTLNSAISLSAPDYIGAPLHIERNEDDAGTSAIIASLTGGTRASPSIVSTGEDVLTIVPLCWDGSGWNFGGEFKWQVAGTPGVGDIKTALTMSSTGGSFVINEDGEYVFSEGAFTINSVDYAFPTSPAEGFVYRDSAGDITFEDLGTPPDITSTVNLTAQNASIGGTGFTGLPSAGTLMKISYYLVITTSDVTAGSVQVDFAWDDGTTGRTESSAALLMTSTGYESGEIVIYKGVSESVQYSVVVSGSPGTAQYALHMRVEAL